LARQFERAFSFVHRTSIRGAWTGRWPCKPLVVLILIAIIGLTAYLYVVVPKGFFPQQDSTVS
jgi:multidrug efflux pump